MVTMGQCIDRSSRQVQCVCQCKHSDDVHYNCFADAEEQKTMIMSTVRKNKLVFLIAMNQYGLKNQNQTILTVSSI